MSDGTFKTQRRPLRSGSPADFGAGFAAAAVLILIVSYVLGTSLWPRLGLTPPDPSIYGYRPELVDAITGGQFPDLRLQKFIYLAVLASVGCVALWLACAPQLPAAAPLMAAGKWLVRSTVAGVVGIAAIYLIDVMRPPRQMIQDLKLRDLDTAILLVLAFGLSDTLRRSLPFQAVPRFAIAAVALLGLFAFAVAPIALRPDIRDWNYFTFTMVELHFAYVVGITDQLAAGARLFDDVVPYYGLLPAAIIGYFVKTFGALDWGAMFRIVQCLQIGMLLCLAMGMYLWKGRRRPFLWIVLPCVLVLPDLFAAYHMIWYPNQTGWRFFGYAIAILCLGALARAPARFHAPILGWAFAAIILWNLETGVVASAGFIGYLLAAGDRARWGRVCASLAVFAISTIVGFLAFAALYRAGYGYWPIPTSVGATINWYRYFLGGPGGLQIKDIDLLALVVFGHCAATILSAARSWRAGPLAFDRRVELALAAMICVWLYYYVNRTQTLNLWSILYLYAPLAAKWFHPLRLKLALRGGRPIFPATLVPAVLIAAWTIQDGKWAYEATRSAFERPPASESVAIPLSGVITQTPIADYISRKVDYVAAIEDKSSVVPITLHSYLVPLMSGVYPSLPVRDVFWQTIREPDFEALIQHLKALAPAEILFDTDPPAGPAAFAAAQIGRMNARLQLALADDYAPAERAAGWEIWRRKSN